jgi:hypothetical protein
MRESLAELCFVNAGLVLTVLSGISVLGALGSVTSPPRGLFLGLQLEKMCPVLGGDEHDRHMARTYEYDWTIARFYLIGEGADRIGVVQWLTSHTQSMAQVGCRRGIRRDVDVASSSFWCQAP